MIRQNIYITIIGISLLIIIIGCNSHNNASNFDHRCIEVDISNPIINDVKLSQLGSEIRYIPLETTDSCLIGSIKKIEVNSKGIFVTDTDKLLRFSKEGKFICSYGGKGRGPGEFIAVLDFEVDMKRDMVILMQDNFIFMYSIDGQFQKQIPTNPRQRYLSRLPDGRFVYLFDWPTFLYNDDYSINIVDYDKETVNQVLSRKWVGADKNDLAHGRSGYAVLEYFCDTLTYWENMSDTIYRIDNSGNIIPKYYLKRENDPPYDASAEEIMSLKYQIITQYLETKEHLIFPQVLDKKGDPLVIFLYEKKTKVAYKVQHDTYLGPKSQLAFYNDIDSGWFFTPKAVSSKGELVSFFWGFDYLESRNLEYHEMNETENSSGLFNAVRNSEPMDNPIVMILK